MKQRALMLFAILIAVPAFAAEQPAATQDSPLVAAAKRAKRSAKKPGTVITNATLKQTGADAHITTTRKQAALPKIVSPAPDSKKAAADSPKMKSKRQAAPHDDAARLEDEPGRGDLVPCPACLPILTPDSKTLPLREAEFSSNPPQVAKPEMAPVVPARTPEAPPR
jgi:hypothetical protein